MKLISLIGGNATGKSTRMTKVIDSLGEVYEPIIFMKKEVGRKYSCGISVIGKRTKEGKWVSMDSFPTNDWQKRFEFFEELANDQKIHTLLIEGYFNMCAVASRPSFWHQHGYDELQFYFFIYDDVNKFLARVNERLDGKKTRDIDWAKDSSGWKDNCGRIKNAYEAFTIDKSECDIVTRLDVDIDVYYFVDLLGLEHKEFGSKQKTNSILSFL